jgi:2-oxoglutarate dehydrogenase E1 component
VALHLAPHLSRSLIRVARAPSASPAVGSLTRHRLEQEQLVREALGEPERPRRPAKVAAQER